MTELKTEYNLFGTKLLITPAYREEAKEHLKSWNTLYAYFQSGNYNEFDLMKLIVIEKEGKGRGQLITRLHSLLISVKRKAQREELNDVRE